MKLLYIPSAILGFAGLSNIVSAATSVGGAVSSNSELPPVTYDLKIYKDAEFEDPHDTGVDLPFVVGHPLYYKVVASRIIPNVEISFLNCIVKSSDGSDHYNIINDMCPASSVNAEIIGPTASDTELKASYSVFEFVKDAQVQPTNTIRLSCQIVLCDETDDSSKCELGCQSDARRKKRHVPFETMDVQTVSADFSFSGTN